MTEKPTRRGRSERPRGRATEGPPEQEDAPDERYGLLVVARNIKDDGRALILYTRAQDSPV